MTVDPLISRAIGSGFALLLLSAAYHKLATRSTFAAVLRDYRLLPASATAAASWLVIGTESALGLGWLLPGTVPVTTVAWATAILLGAYAAAMGINLVRGRAAIHCGCGLTATSAGGQQLSWRLVLRNGLLVAVALLGALPAATRSLGPADYATLVAALLAAGLLYVATGQLLSNSASIAAWRDAND